MATRPARRAVQKTDLNQERLVDLFERVFLFSQRGGQRAKADRTTVVLLNDGEQTACGSISSKPCASTPSMVSRSVGRRPVDGSRAAYLRIVAHAPQQAVGDARRSA